MQQTDNFSLPLYEANDAPNLLDGYNAAMRTIDTEIKNNADTISITSSNLAGKAPVDHATSTGTYGVGTNILFGHVQLSDAIDNTSNVSNGVAATPYAVKSVYDDLNSIVQDHENMISAKAPINHASTTTTYGAATEEDYGHVRIQLSNDRVNSSNAASVLYVNNLFNFTNTEATLPSSFSGAIHIAVNSNKTMFKVYGWYKHIRTTVTRTAIPSFDNLYGVKIYSDITTPTPYRIQTGGIYLEAVAATNANVDFNTTSLIVSTDGIYIDVSSNQTTTYDTNFVYATLPACLYFNSSFNDTIESVNL